MSEVVNPTNNVKNRFVVGVAFAPDRYEDAVKTLCFVAQIDGAERLHH